MERIKAVRQSTAAKRIGMDSGQLARMIRAGRVRIVETADGLALVPLAEVERLKGETRRVGRPRADAT